MLTDTINFYNQESARYSDKRYLGLAKTYVQYFFQRRLSLVLSLLQIIIADQKNLSLLDVACADGIITQAIAEKFSAQFSHLLGVDIAPDMVAVAAAKNRDPRINFLIKDQTPEQKFDLVLGLGFISGGILAEEMAFAKKHLKPGAYFICTLPSKYSIRALLTIRDKDYYQGYWSYRHYRQFLATDFDIVATRPYGFFIPWLWKWPTVARPSQALIEAVLARLVPGLFHEQIFCLRLKA
jgi:SAM-dependent methyltransferase